jgi:hypothetical protein
MLRPPKGGPHQPRGSSFELPRISSAERCATRAPCFSEYSLAITRITAVALVLIVYFLDLEMIKSAIEP